LKAALALFLLAIVWFVRYILTAADYPLWYHQTSSIIVNSHIKAGVVITNNMFPPENKEVSNEGMYNPKILHRSKLDICHYCG
jgi:hypothetical protein